MGVVDPFSVARAAGLELTGKSEGLTLTGKGCAHKRHRATMGD